jgi:hypothetical protein
MFCGSLVYLLLFLVFCTRKNLWQPWQRQVFLFFSSHPILERYKPLHLPDGTKPFVVLIFCLSQLRTFLGEVIIACLAIKNSN